MSRAVLAALLLAAAAACGDAASERASEVRQLESLAAEARLFERAARADRITPTYTAEHARALVEALDEHMRKLDPRDLSTTLAHTLARARATLEALAVQ